eukprot:CAMPEP_0198318364 /NCGR_PEP_ID=MMETSP1450-20131203/7697_1 /TAXON_ID=753684 ORGANISM="Madagascaria erythrocladiodes, Strain CCMP3234" /NCGR_SAMPLE_ID=MMETSP1450 /ASSEMBLY_ACC=CAM_ASM_001115 /LENGTH=97 /DNA_ID=CAMNT_0044021659 /DNA_START=11 /DNA_END=300 /DNA_ORIENTATION=-
MSSATATALDVGVKKRLAATLAATRGGGGVPPLAEAPAELKSASLADADDVQRLHVATLCALDDGAHAIGFKVGAANAAGQAALGCSAPLYGTLVSS